MCAYVLRFQHALGWRLSCELWHHACVQGISATDKACMLGLMPGRLA